MLTQFQLGMPQVSSFIALPPMYSATSLTSKIKIKKSFHKLGSKIIMSGHISFYT